MNCLYSFNHNHDHHCHQPSMYLFTAWNTKYPKMSHIIWEICVGGTSRHHTYISDLYCTLFCIYFIVLIFRVSVFLLTVFEALQLHFVVRWQPFDHFGWILAYCILLWCMTYTEMVYWLSFFRRTVVDGIL